MVKLFTDDTGPAQTADDLGVPYQMIDERWRRQRTETAEAKELRGLRAENTMLRAQEPLISLGSSTVAGDFAKTLKGAHAGTLSQIIAAQQNDRLRTLLAPQRELASALSDQGAGSRNSACIRPDLLHDPIIISKGLWSNLDAMTPDPHERLLDLLGLRPSD